MADSSVDGKGRAPIELWIAGAAAILLGTLCLLVLRPFISAALWAVILCFTTWPMFLRLEWIAGRTTNTVGADRYSVPGRGYSRARCDPWSHAGRQRIEPDHGQSETHPCRARRVRLTGSRVFR